MVYLVGVIGFICGFMIGQLILARMLRDRTNEELKSDKSLRIYGILNWLVAGLTAAAAVSLYRAWFGSF